MLPNVSLSIKQNVVTEKLIAKALLKSLYSRLLNNFRHLLTSKRLARNFIMSQENPKNLQKQTIGLQFYQTIPRRVKILHNNQI